MSLKFCPKCGNELEPGSSYCDSCGARLETRTESTQATSPSLTQTAQEARVSQGMMDYPDFLKRLIALIFDSIIIGLIGSIFSLILVNPWFPLNMFDPFRAWWFTFPFDWLIGFLYHWGMESYNNGQTLGKMALSIRTVDEKTLGQASPSNLALNNLFKSSPFLILDLIFGVVKNSGDPKRRIRIMQNVSETVVIFAK